MDKNISNFLIKTQVNFKNNSTVEQFVQSIKKMADFINYSKPNVDMIFLEIV